MRLALFGTAACAVALVCASAPAAAAQDPKPAGPAIAGTWALNQDLSDAPQRMRSGGGRMGGGRMGGMGGRGMGGRGGGGMGGGGTGGGGMGGAGTGDAGGMSTDSGGPGGGMMRPALRLTITQNDSSVTVRDADAPQAHTYMTDGRTLREFFERGEAEVTSKWKGDKLEVVRKSEGGATVTQSYRIDPKLRRLVVTTKIEGGRMGRSMEIKRVYDPAEPTP